jgi:hypothetical protein
MKKKFIFSFLLLLFIIPVSNAQEFSDAFRLYKTKNFFALRDAIPKTKYTNGWQKKYLESLSGNVFSDFKNSNTLISGLLKDHSKEIPDSLKAELYMAKSNNHVNLYEYKDALECDLLVTKNYSAYLEDDEKEDIPDDINLWSALKDAEPQTIIKQGEVTIPVKKDIANLWNIPVTINDENTDFIFDTGANFSVIVESLAKKFGLKLIDTKMKVGSITGAKVDCKVAVCPSMKIKDITINNAVFLVLPDDALSFGFYKIKGIVGNPVIRSFEEIRIVFDTSIIVSAAPSKSSVQNLAFHGFTPVIQMFRGTDTLIFTFDSGAMATMLYRPYFDAYKNEIEDKLKLVDITIGGAGGMKTIKGYYIPSLELTTNGKTGKLSNTSLLSEFSKNKDKFFYGNLGQDYFENFKEMTINFKEMFIEFR